MKRALVWLGCWLTACSYYHIGETRATFRQAGPTLMLHVDRHLDTVMRGPDVEEDQYLTLELTGYEIGQSLSVPGSNAVARLRIERDGPDSVGSICAGSVMVTSVSEKKIVAKLHLDITARTSSGRYVQHVKYRGEHTFFRRDD